MPRLLGVNVLGAVLAAVAMFFAGFVFYGLLFSDIWAGARGYTPQMLEAYEASGEGGIWMIGGFIIELWLAFGLGWLIQKVGAKGIAACVGVAVMAAVLFALPMQTYDYVYGLYHSWQGLLVDWGHSLVAFILAGLVLSFFD